MFVKKVVHLCLTFCWTLQTQGIKLKKKLSQQHHFPLNPQGVPQQIYKEPLLSPQGDPSKIIRNPLLNPQGVPQEIYEESTLNPQGVPQQIYQEPLLNPWGEQQTTTATTTRQRSMKKRVQKNVCKKSCSSLFNFLMDPANSRNQVKENITPITFPTKPLGCALANL